MVPPAPHILIPDPACPLHHVTHTVFAQHKLLLACSISNYLHPLARPAVPASRLVAALCMAPPPPRVPPQPLHFPWMDATFLWQSATPALVMMAATACLSLSRVGAIASWMNGVPATKNGITGHCHSREGAGLRGNSSWILMPGHHGCCDNGLLSPISSLLPGHTMMV
jgi:hypothetical protein